MNKQTNIQAIKRVYFMRRRRKPRGDTKTLRPIKVNKSLRAQYREVLQELTKKISASIHANLFSVLDSVESKVKQNSAADILTQAFDIIRSHADMLTVLASKKAKNIIDKFDDHTKNQFYSSVKDALGIDLTGVITTPNVQQQIQAVTDENFNLIKSLTDNQLAEVKTLTYQQLTKGDFDAKVLKTILLDRFGIAKRRADLIATDQSQKITASLNRIRYQSVGVEKYIWRNSNDLRVRGNPIGYYPKSKYNHWTREGKIYSYANPPPDGNPGIPVRCRCYAEAIMPETIFKQ